MELLNYKIPTFKTIAWVSDEAKMKWENRFKAINEAILTTTVQVISEGKRHQQIVVVEGHYYFKLIQLSKTHSISLDFNFLGDEKAKGPIFYEVILKKEKDTVITSSCCSVCSETVREQGKKEFVWEAAKNTNEAEVIENTISLSPSNNTSVFWQKLLVTVGSQHHCQLNCKHQLNMQEELMKQLDSYGFKEEAIWLKEIYTWPLEWSARHGICELRTPIVKLAYDTDATLLDHTLQIKGENYPEEGAPGNRFPYRQKSFLRVTDSKSFKTGLQHGS